MKGITNVKLTKGLFVNSRLKCADNSGAKELYIIDVIHKGNTKSRKKGALLGDILKVSVKKGLNEMVGKMYFATLIRQIKPIKRSNGLRVGFEDNAAVILNEDYVFKYTKIKGVISKEASEKIPSLGSKGAQIL